MKIYLNRYSNFAVFKSFHGFASNAPVCAVTKIASDVMAVIAHFNIYSYDRFFVKSKYQNVTSYRSVIFEQISDHKLSEIDRKKRTGEMFHI